MMRTPTYTILAVVLLFILGSCGTGTADLDQSSSDQSGTEGAETAAVEGSAGEAGSVNVGETIQDPLVRAGLTAFNFQPLKTPVPLPDFALDNLEGTSIPISTYKGKWILLNFWATWCPPCRAEMPGMNELQKAFGGEHFTFVAIDSQEEPATVREFIAREKYILPVLLDVDGSISATFGINSLPTTFLVDPQGLVQGGMIGSQNYDTPETRAFLKSISK